MGEKKDLPIAVIDSGVGGISVLRELRKLLPNEDFLYFGDIENAPYGRKSREEVLILTRNNLEALKAHGIKALVIACNTATSAAARVLRAENPDLPIIGIEPAVKPASLLSAHPRVLVMATTLTLREEKFKSLVSRFSEGGEFIPLPCPGLVELIEEGDTDSPAILTYLKTLFAPYQEMHIDGIVLGCTHYPHVKKAISRFFPPTTAILDGGAGTARQTMRRLAELDLLRTDGDGGVTFFGDPPAHFQAVAESLLSR